MKVIIDMDKMIEDIQSIEPPQRANYLLQKMREIYKNEPVPWAERIKEKPSKVVPKNYTEAFEAFWKKYPRKTGKRIAFKAWWKLAIDVGEKTLAAICMKALEWQVDLEQWKKDDGQFIPHPATWLNQERFMDEAPEISQTGSEYLAPDGTWKRR